MLRTGRTPRPPSGSARRRSISRRATAGARTGLAVGGCADRGDEVLVRQALDQVPVGAGAQADHPQLGILRAGQQDDLTSGARAGDRARGGDPVHPDHDDVHQHDVGAEVHGEVDGVAAVVGLGDDDDPGVLQRRAHAAAEHRVVVGDDDARRSRPHGSAPGLELIGAVCRRRRLRSRAQAAAQRAHGSWPRP